MSDTIRDRLLAPGESGTIADLHATWFETVIRCRIAGYGKLMTDPGLAGRIRGAFGDVLKKSASPQALAGEPCPWQPPCGFEVLFRKQGRMEAGLDFPSPWIIALDSHGADLVVSLSLFGFACEWAAMAADAFSEALMRGVNWVPKRDLFVPAVQMLERRIAAVAAPRVWPDAERVVMEFISPVVLSTTSPVERPHSLITSLAARLAGIGRWHDLDVVNDRQALKQAVEQVSFSWTELEGVSWQRGSKRQDRSIPMKGLRGKLLLEGDAIHMSMLMPILALGTRCFAGADVAYGCGRYAMLAG